MVKFATSLLLIYICLSPLGGGNPLAGEQGDIHNPIIEKSYRRLPGMEEMDQELTTKFDRMLEKRGKAYKPRTRHLLPDGSAMYTNRLFLETSPYLLQHAHNPVNWYPWGDEAFEAARRLNRPVLLSVGYSTCHWCHVMEEESFEDPEIAKYLNEHYIAIKVDREERPDLDAVYMAAVQALTGRGGWPMNVFLTPDKKPFYGGTYFPARDGDRGASMGFLTILEKLGEMYRTKRDTVDNAGNQLSDAVARMLTPKAGSGLPGADLLHAAITSLEKIFDPTHGGVKGAPKFPSTLPVRLLLRYHRRTGNEKALEMATRTLDAMAFGGIYDQLGGGFHRYSTDEKWLVPHFEKMLYDNALLTLAFLEGFQATGNDTHRRIVMEVLAYVQREMTSPEGGFYSATDADSMTPGGHMEEGWFFTWTPEELEEILGERRAGIFKEYYSVGKTPDFEGRHILHINRPMKETAKRLGLSVEETAASLSESKVLLMTERSKRPLPLRDDKILTSWNGLMISAFARAGFVLDAPKFTEAAENAARLVLDKLMKDGRLLRSYKDNAARHNAYLDDYTFLITGLLDLYEATHDPAWLGSAIGLDKVLETFHEDTENGGFFMTSSDHEKLIAREKPAFDGALPSGNSPAISNLLRLHGVTGEASYLKRAHKALKAFSSILESNPAGLGEMLLSIETLLDRPMEIVIVTPAGDKEGAEPFLSELRRVFLPNKAVVVIAENDGAASIPPLKYLAGGKGSVGGKTTAYVCEGGTCKLPVSAPEAFRSRLLRVEAL